MSLRLESAENYVEPLRCELSPMPLPRLRPTMNRKGEVTMTSSLKEADLAGPGIGDYADVESVLPQDYEPLLGTAGLIVNVIESTFDGVVASSA